MPRTLLPLLLLALLAPACRHRQKSGPRSVLGKTIDEGLVGVGGAEVRLVIGDHSRAAQTDAAGWFAFHGVPLGDGWVEATASGYFGERRGIRSGMVVLHLERTRSIEGVVLFDGRPVEGAVVAAHPLPDGPAETGWSDAEGRFVVGGLRRGAHGVTVSLPPDARGADGAYLACRNDLRFSFEAGVGSARIEFPAGARVVVKTNFSSVTIDGPAIVSRRYDVGPDRTLAVRGLPAGEYRVTFHHDDGKTQSVDESIAEGQELPIEMYLPE
ncbi:MAG: carboxypeptidase-like regulatory domain-containing protein [Planctomycetota bacterium]